MSSHYVVVAKNHGLLGGLARVSSEILANYPDATRHEGGLPVAEFREQIDLKSRATVHMFDRFITIEPLQGPDVVDLLVFIKVHLSTDEPIVFATHSPETVLDLASQSRRQIELFVDAA